MRVKIEEVDGSEMERGTTGRIVEVEEGDAVETCFICDRSSVNAKSEEFEGEAARYGTCYKDPLFGPLDPLFGP